MIVARRACLRPIRPPPAIKAIRTLSFRPTTPMSLPRRNLPSSSFLAKRQKPLRIRRSSSRDRLLPPLPFIGPSNSIDNDSFDQLLPLEQIRRCFNLPVPITCERLRDARLDALFFNESALKAMAKEEREFLVAYHPQPLEFVGDRIWSALTAKVAFLSLPPGGSNVGPLQAEIVRLCTNSIAARLARELGLASSRMGEKPAADRFEAYLTALEFANGHKSLLKFLVPLIRREFFARFDSIPSLIVGSTEGLQDQASASLVETNPPLSAISPTNLPTTSPAPTSRTPIKSTEHDSSQSIEASPTFPPADLRTKPVSDRRTYYMSAPKSSLRGRRKLQQKFVKIGRLHVEINLTFPEQGTLSGSGTSLDEAAGILYTELLKYGLVTQNADVPIQRQAVPFNYHGGVDTVNFLLTPDLDRLARKTNGSLQWSQSLHLPGWEPILFEGRALTGNVKIKSLFEAAIGLGAIQILDDATGSNGRLQQEHDTLTQDLDELAVCNELSKETPEKEVAESNPPAKEMEDLENIDDLVGSTLLPPQTQIFSDELDTRAQGSSFAPSTPSPPPSLRPQASATTSAPIFSSNGTTSSPPHQVASFETALREIEAIPGTDTKFSFKVVLPGYGVAESSDSRPGRARDSVMKELMRLGAVTRDRSQPIQYKRLPFNYYGSYFYLLLNLEEVCRDLPDSSIEWEWSVTFSNQPRLSLKATGSETRKLHWKHLVRAALEAGYIKIKPPEETESAPLPSPTTSIDRSLPTKLTTSPPISSPSFLDDLSDSFSTDTTTITECSSVSSRALNEADPSSSTDQQKL